MAKERRQLTAVFACELADDLGFGAPLPCIAQRLGQLAAERGWSIKSIFALSDPIYCGAEVAAQGHAVLAAPLNRWPREIASRGNSYATILATHGFAHAQDLELRLKSWDQIFALVGADVVIADRSPSACLAARGRLPLVVVGSGDDTPPADLTVFPAIVRDAPSEINQSVICAAVNQVLKSRCVRQIQYLPELMAGDRRVVFSVPQLDPYLAHRHEKLYRPCIDIEGRLEPCETPSLFFALPSTFRSLGPISRALERVGVAVSCYIPGPETVALAMVQHSGARVWRTRPSIADALSGSAIVLTASADLASAAYLAGRPQLVLRSDLQTSTIASELDKRRVAMALDLAEVADLPRALSELLHNTSFARSAQEEARRAQPSEDLEDGAALVAQECLKLVEGPWNKLN